MNGKDTILVSALFVMSIVIVLLVLQINIGNPGRDVDSMINPVLDDTTVVPTPKIIPVTIPTTTHTPTVTLPVQIEDYDNHVLFSLDGTHEFDRSTDMSYKYDRTTDIDDEMTITLWFRRDVFNNQQFLISKGHWSDRKGWRLMIKQTKPPYQYEQIQFDVGNKKSLNYYKTLDGIMDHDWHSIVVLFNANKIYVDSKGIETHGVILLDGKPEYYMACPPEDKNEPPISEVVPYRAPMYIGRHSDQKNKYYFTGGINNITIMDVDIGIEAAQNWHETTKIFI